MSRKLNKKLVLFGLVLGLAYNLACMLSLLKLYFSGVTKYKVFTGIISMGGNERFVMPVVNYYFEALPELVFMAITTIILVYIFIHFANYVIDVEA